MSQNSNNDIKHYSKFKEILFDALPVFFAIYATSSSLTCIAMRYLILFPCHKGESTVKVNTEKYVWLLCFSAELKYIFHFLNHSVHILTPDILLINCILICSVDKLIDLIMHINICILTLCSYISSCILIFFFLPLWIEWHWTLFT